MTLDDRRLSRCIHMLSIAVAVAALSVFLSTMGRIAGDVLTVGTSLAIAAVFVGVPSLTGLTAWSDRTSVRTPVMSAYLILSGLVSAGMFVVSIRLVGAGTDVNALACSFIALSVSIALAVAAAFVRDRRHGLVVA